MTEDQLLIDVVNAAAEHGIIWYHCYDSRYAYGKGFPDLVLTGKRRTIFVELKSDYANLEPEQTTWKYRLLATGMHHEVWRPSDLSGHIESVMETL